MNAMEVVLLIVGAAIFILSFVLPAKRENLSAAADTVAKEEIKALVEQEMAKVKSHVEDVVDESIGYAVEKTERSLERLSNEKIMAVNEYSDTVLQEIHKNHEEVMFLYDMLNDKHTNIKNTVTEVNKTVKEVAATKKEAEAVVQSFKGLAPESVQPELQTIPVAKPVAKAKAKEGTAKKSENTMDLSFINIEPTDGSNNNEEILKLYKEGKSNVAIAKKLGLGVGEVKLVIDLYKNV